jgi:hypothetical protein
VQGARVRRGEIVRKPKRAAALVLAAAKRAPARQVLRGQVEGAVVAEVATMLEAMQLEAAALPEKQAPTPWAWAA